MYYDAHTHLNEESLYPTRQALLDEFIAVGGKGLVNIGVDPEYNEKALEIAKEASKIDKYNGLFIKATIGFHPYLASDNLVNEANYQIKVDEMMSLYEANKEHIVAIGEIGIDTHFEGTIETLVLQKKLFAAQCEYARQLALPVVIHSRANFEATMDVLQEYKDLTIYFHCRGYGPKEIETVVATFPSIYVGFCGNTSYKKAEKLRTSIQKLRELSPASLLLETDAPYLTPQAVRKERNKPSLIPHLYAFVANFLGTDEKELQSITAQNFKSLYGSDKNSG